MKTAIAAGLMFASSAVLAAPITFDNLGSTAFDFGFVGSGKLHVCTVNCLFDITGPAFSPPDTGTFTMGPTDFMIGPEVAGSFPAGPNSQTFNFLAADGDTLAGTINWSRIDDGTLTPAAHGTLHVTSSSGDATWLASWGGAPFDVAISFDMTIFCSLSNLAANSCPTTVQESIFHTGGTGDLTREVRETPEPASWLMLATALLATLGLYLSTGGHRAIRDGTARAVRRAV
jgi:hypothetical protein